jgi:two-component system phosphate regulon sensor histidine kinase PhoR
MDLEPAGNPNQQLDHERLTALINSMADAVIAVDDNIKIVLYNAAALNILDVNTIKEGEPLSYLLKPVDRDNQAVGIDAMIRQATTPVTNRDLRLQYSEGSTINLYISIAPVHLGYGKEGKGGHVVLLRDITREKSLEEERDEFISVVSHELRTPIAIAEGNIGNVEFLVEKGSDITAVKQALKEAHNQVLFLANMMNDLSTLSRAERGKLEVEVEGINVHELVTELGNNFNQEAQKKGLTVKTEIDPKLELLNSSKLYVREVLQNFITNAIKYTERGSVTIRAAARDKGVAFEVSDTGIGIGKADQERVFDKFFRSEDYRTRQANGTGLGLYVTMKLASLLHAEISLESELNKGSTFKIFIPNLQ